MILNSEIKQIFWLVLNYFTRKIGALMMLNYEVVTSHEEKCGFYDDTGYIG